MYSYAHCFLDFLILLSSTLAHSAFFSAGNNLLSYFSTEIVFILQIPSHKQLTL